MTAGAADHDPEYTRNDLDRAEQQQSGCRQVDRTIREIGLAASGAVNVPATCPIGWSVEGYHGHSRTTLQTPRPGLTHMSKAAEET